MKKSFSLPSPLPALPCRVVCPVCEGGSSRERSLYISESGSSVMWYCHRASCGNRGRKLKRGRKLIEGTTEAPEKLSEPVYKPPPRGYIPRPVKDAEGALRGYVYRRGESLPDTYAKDINRIDGGWVKLHFPSPFYGDTIMLVEDWASAEAMNKFFPCAALLGVHLNEEKLSYLLTRGVKRVILALDNDATKQSVINARRTLLDVQVLPLERDLKDETETNLKEIAENLK